MEFALLLHPHRQRTGNAISHWVKSLVVVIGYLTGVCCRDVSCVMSSFFLAQSASLPSII